MTTPDGDPPRFPLLPDLTIPRTSTIRLTDRVHTEDVWPRHTPGQNVIQAVYDSTIDWVGKGAEEATWIVYDHVTGLRFDFDASDEMQVVPPDVALAAMYEERAELNDRIERLEAALSLMDDPEALAVFWRMLTDGNASTPAELAQVARAALRGPTDA